jgi:hypothetical protein
MRRLILFLLRLKLGLKNYEPFRFENQNSKVDYYYFHPEGIMKVNPRYTRPSHVSLNHMLSDECEIVKIDKKGL